MGKGRWSNRKYVEKLREMRDRGEHILSQNGGGRGGKSDRECWCGASHRIAMRGRKSLVPGLVMVVGDAWAG